MREGTAPLKVAHKQGTPTTSGLTTKSFTTSDNGGTTAVHPKGRKTTSRKVKFTTPPKHKTRHSLKNIVSSRSGKPRTALKTLQPHASNTKILVGAGSPRIASIGKSKKALKQTQLPLSPPPLGPTVITLTEECEKSEPCGSQPKEHCPAVTARGESDTKCDPTIHSVDYRMVTEDTPPTEYWQVLAEKRRLALAETLQENKELYEEIDKLKAQVKELENQVQDKNYFAMMYKLVSGKDSS